MKNVGIETPGMEGEIIACVECIITSHALHLQAL